MKLIISESAEDTSLSCPECQKKLRKTPGIEVCCISYTGGEGWGSEYMFILGHYR